jgi:hypothetical protein
VVPAVRPVNSIVGLISTESTVMGEPPVYVAVAVYPLAPVTGSQVTVADVEEEEVTLTLVGMARGATGGVEAAEESEDDVVPFVATTVNVYSTPGVSPDTVIDNGSEEVPVNPSGEEVAVYEVASGTAAVRVTVAEVEVVEETLEITGVDRLVPVRTKGVPEPTLVHIVPAPGK